MLKKLLLSTPFEGKTIEELNALQGLTMDGNNVICALELPHRLKDKAENLKNTISEKIKTVFKNNEIKVIVTLKKEAPKTTPKPPQKDTLLLPNVKNIIAISSAKGGVGKSTIASNIACIMAQKGYKVGLLDADIYGPSLPKLFGLEGKKPEQTDNKKIKAFEKFGLKLMSIGFMVDAESPMVWRGPIVQSALIQLLKDVDWRTLDFLFIDMPPGTGDVQLTLAQKVKLNGAAIISTPQDIALIDARKGLKMFEKMEVPILGLIENMSYHICSSCGEKDHIFGHDGVLKDAEKYGVPFLGQIPLHRKIREQADKGQPLSSITDELELKSFYEQISKAILVSLETATKAEPVIKFIA